MLVETVAVVYVLLVVFFIAKKMTSQATILTGPGALPA
jgi:hypothetical protein